jgi:hypothetical protein
MRRFIAVATVVLVATATAAHAYFTTTGAGGGATNVGTMQTVTVVALTGGDTPSSLLYPGGPAADVVLRVNNPNITTVQITAVAANGAITADAGHAGCTTTGVTFTPPVNSAINLASGASVLHLAGAATMSNASMSACQGATFNVPVLVTARR